MDCTKCQSLIEGFLKQSLSAAETEEFIRHVKGCPECYGELEVYHMVNSVVSELDSGEEGNDTDYKASLERMLNRVGTKKRRRRFARYFIFAVVITLLIVIYFLLSGMLGHLTAG
ncbi:MAG: zf-HC2 domain-containing protein [Lachnospiraceae bacterium]|nr:zf-HC2 domain-containing protein [Lachnospiraceae bacterium]